MRNFQDTFVKHVSDHLSVLFHLHHCTFNAINMILVKLCFFRSIIIILIFFFKRLDPKDLDILLGEIVLLSSRTELYQNFLRARLKVLLGI